MNRELLIQGSPSSFRFNKVKVTIVKSDFSIVIGKQTMPVIVSRIKRARYMRLRLNYRNQIAVTAPSHCSDRQALRFVEKHHRWLEQQLARVPKVYTIHHWLLEHPHVSACGKQYTVSIKKTSGRRSGYLMDNEKGEIVFNVPEAHESPDADLQQLMKSFARDVIADRLDYHAQRLGLKFNKLSIRDQISCWGSCSSKGNISLNWRLILIAPELQDYVLLHELAHLTEMNHSDRFRQLLISYDPDHVAHEMALNSTIAEIMRVGR